MSTVRHINLDRGFDLYVLENIGEDDIAFLDTKGDLSFGIQGLEILFMDISKEMLKCIFIHFIVSFILSDWFPSSFLIHHRISFITKKSTGERRKVLFFLDSQVLFFRWHNYIKFLYFFKLIMLPNRLFFVFFLFLGYN
ncbi:hypothetical protein P148_SR1C00001G0855 [candidate division SR1 bacterium RAAC1_SR1_1]|nr:hypothetical protein P148_SR1C00001G0855 [candidate division SR1 bacterium RAAC1_SR1_1]